MSALAVEIRTDFEGPVHGPFLKCCLCHQLSYGLLLLLGGRLKKLDSIN